jgi:hypothetical protein
MQQSSMLAEEGSREELLAAEAEAEAAEAAILSFRAAAAAPSALLFSTPSLFPSLVARAVTAAGALDAALADVEVARAALAAVC